jgi:hypothetical protein
MVAKKLMRKDESFSLEKQRILVRKGDHFELEELNLIILQGYLLCHAKVLNWKKSLGYIANTVLL